MCEPVTIAIVTAAVIGAGAQIQQGRAQRQIADANARNQRAAAKDALERGEVQVDLARRRGSVFKGRQRSALAASGVELDFGSAIDILEDTASAVEFQVLSIRANAEREAFALRSAAEVSSFQGEQLQQQAFLGASATLLGGAARAGAFELDRGGTDFDLDQVPPPKTRPRRRGPLSPG